MNSATSLVVALALWCVSYAGSGRTWEQAMYFAQPVGAFPAVSVDNEEGVREGEAVRRPGRVPFGIGEYLEFSVNYNVLRAGTATMEVKGIEQVDGHDCYKIASTARSNTVISTFFEVRDRVESLMDVTELFSRRFEKHLREGKYVKDEVIEIDQGAGLAYYADGDTAEILPSTQDALSSLYFVRTLDLAVGRLVAFPNHSGKKNYPLRVRVLGKEKIKTPAGRFACLVVEPRLKSEGIFKHKGRLTVWLTDDDLRLPVKMKSQIKIGAITAELIRWERGRPYAGGAGGVGSPKGGD